MSVTLFGSALESTLGMQLKKLHVTSITIDPSLDFSSASCSWEELKVSAEPDLATIAALPLRGLSSPFHMSVLWCVCAPAHPCTHLP